jgi:hypothetical protein
MCGIEKVWVSVVVVGWVSLFALGHHCIIMQQHMQLTTPSELMLVNTRHQHHP